MIHIDHIHFVVPPFTVKWNYHLYSVNYFFQFWFLKKEIQKLEIFHLAFWIRIREATGTKTGLKSVFSQVPRIRIHIETVQIRKTHSTDMLIFMLILSLSWLNQHSCSDVN